MHRTTSPRLLSSTALAATWLVAALVSGRPELAVLALPFLLLVCVALVGEGGLEIAGGLRLERDRALEGEHVAATVTLRNTGAAARVEVAVPVASRLATSESHPVAFWLGRGEVREVQVDVIAGRWGAHEVGPPAVRARDRLGAFTLEGRLGHGAELRVYPAADRLRRLVAPVRTRPVLGSLVSRERGEGIEFADLRPLAAGDRVRSINWRATARRREPYVNVQHPEHSADVVLFLDTFAAAEHAEEGTLDAAVRTAATLASAAVARRDRVALVSFGGEVTWLTPGAGERQLYRIIDALLASDARRSFWWRDLTHVPPRLLPARALVLGITPLLDARGVAALLDLRARGHDVAVIEVSPVLHVRPDDTATGRRARRLWRLQREALRARFTTLGVPVGHAEAAGADLDLVMQEVIAFRRHARPALRG